MKTINKIVEVFIVNTKRNRDGRTFWVTLVDPNNPSVQIDSSEEEYQETIRNINPDKVVGEGPLTVSQFKDRVRMHDVLMLVEGWPSEIWEK